MIHSRGDVVGSLLRGRLSGGEPTTPQLWIAGPRGLLFYSRDRGQIWAYRPLVLTLRVPQLRVSTVKAAALSARQFVGPQARLFFPEPPAARRYRTFARWFFA